MDGVHHVFKVKRTLSPRFLSLMTVYDVASTFISPSTQAPSFPKELTLRSHSLSSRVSAQTNI